MPMDTAVFFAKFRKVSLDYLSGMTDDFDAPPNVQVSETATADIGIDPGLYFGFADFPKNSRKFLYILEKYGKIIPCDVRTGFKFAEKTLGA